MMLFFAVVASHLIGGAFSGEATRYARFVLHQVQMVIAGGACAAVALVVAIPVCWRGRKAQRFIALILVILSALLLLVLFTYF